MVGTMDVVDRHRLRAMRSTYPVCVRQVDTDRSSGVRVSREHSYRDDGSRDASWLLLLEAWIDGSMILEPLGLGAYLLSPLTSFVVTDMHEALPHPLHA